MADNGIQVSVDFRVKQRLEKIASNSENCSLGYLYGEVILNKARVFGCVACRNSNPPSKSGFPGIPDWKTEYAELSAIIPTGLPLCGIYYSCLKPGTLEANYLEEVIIGKQFEDPSSANGKFVVLQICTSNDCRDSCRCFMYDRQAGSIVQCKYQEADIFGEFQEARISFRILANIQISLDINKDDNGSSDIAWKIERSCRELSSLSAVYHVKDCNMLLGNQGNTNIVLPKTSCEENCDTLLGAIQHNQEKMFSIPGVTKNKRKQKGGKAISSSSGPKSKDVLEVRLLNQLTETDNSEESFVPVIQFKKAKVKCVKIDLPVDAVLNLPRRTPLQNLPKLFTSSICSQLRKMASVVKEFSKGGVFSAPSVYHFKPPGFCHLITAVYPGIMSNGNAMNDEELTSCRLELHKRLLLPENRPLTRPSIAYRFENEKQQGIYLTNPHDGLAKGSCGTVAVVDGKYAYHHYMQDNFNDDGWGCAYRSLQTISSWFRYQGYTSKPVPTHREIQQALVDLQDKSDEFVGSRQWIGSFEVSMFLEHLIGVTSKIMFVSSGAEMSSKGRDLLHHFQSQGTPVMIGGGVLAHTILGVDFNDQTGDVRFLILDPHYTGGEDLKFILDKGWCGWKGPDFWNQQAHYNMCMPQRPDMI